MTHTFSTNPKDWVFKSQRQRVSPFPNIFSMETICNDMIHKVGFNADEILLFYKDNVHYCFLSRKSYEKVGRGVADNMHNDPKLADKLVEGQKKTGKVLVDFCREVHDEVSSKTSNERLVEIFSTYEKYYKDLYSGYGWIWIFEDDYIGDLLKIVESKIEDKLEAPNILDVLTKEFTAMVATVERKALLELGLEIEKNKEWVDLIKTGDKDKIEKEKDLYALLKKHETDYFWVTRDYEDPILGVPKVIERLSEYFETDIQKEYDELVETFEKGERLREKYLSELDFSQKEIDSINSMRRTAYLKELRKRFVSESLYYFDKILLEIGKRLYLSINQVRHMKIEDMRAGLLEDKDLSHELNERINLSMWHTYTGSDADVTIDESAKELFATFCAVDKSATEFTGMPVSPGVARGPVKIIINPDECNTVKEGDVILSIQVVPSFSSAIMKAGALICDGGHGITTHPATLAREAGIPGVIQTRFAREALKDGDMVEVDGNKGIVRKV
ncbi:hypothetical protein C0581_00900 [Candidatus Parcubacteria bacterium]|nr:MAG: hypothetical protein C0581_00900 [Candidatus Parcubacteria bacterium]